MEGKDRRLSATTQAIRFIGTDKADLEYGTYKIRCSVITSDTKDQIVREKIGKHAESLPEGQKVLIYGTIIGGQRDGESWAHLIMTHKEIIIFFLDQLKAEARANGCEYADAFLHRLDPTPDNLTGLERVLQNVTLKLTLSEKGCAFEKVYDIPNIQLFDTRIREILEDDGA